MPAMKENINSNTNMDKDFSMIRRYVKEFSPIPSVVKKFTYHNSPTDPENTGMNFKEHRLSLLQTKKSLMNNYYTVYQ